MVRSYLSQSRSSDGTEIHHLSDAPTGGTSARRRRPARSTGPIHHLAAASSLPATHACMHPTLLHNDRRKHASVGGRAMHTNVFGGILRARGLAEHRHWMRSAPKRTSPLCVSLVEWARPRGVGQTPAQPVVSMFGRGHPPTPLPRVAHRRFGCGRHKMCHKSHRGKSQRYVTSLARRQRQQSQHRIPLGRSHSKHTYSTALTLSRIPTSRPHVETVPDPTWSSTTSNARPKIISVPPNGPPNSILTAG